MVVVSFWCHGLCGVSSHIRHLVGDWLTGDFLVPAPHVPVVDETGTLGELGGRIRSVAGKEKVIAGLYAPCWG